MQRVGERTGALLQLGQACAQFVGDAIERGVTRRVVRTVGAGRILEHCRSDVFALFTGAPAQVAVRFMPRDAHRRHRFAAGRQIERQPQTGTTAALANGVRWTFGGAASDDRVPALGTRIEPATTEPLAVDQCAAQLDARTADRPRLVGTCRMIDREALGRAADPFTGRAGMVQAQQVGLRVVREDHRAALLPRIADAVAQHRHRQTRGIGVARDERTPRFEFDGERPVRVAHGHGGEGEARAEGRRAEPRQAVLRSAGMAERARGHVPRRGQAVGPLLVGW